MPSPSSTIPSSGIILPVRTTIVSFSLTWSMPVRISCPSDVRTQTLSTFSDIADARSSTDFLWVHSSMISPIPRRNITLPAVLNSPRSIATVMDAASRTETSILPERIDRTAFTRYGTAFTAVRTVRRGRGRRNLAMPLLAM